MMAKIILLAALFGTTESDLSIIFVTSFNAVGGDDCTLISQPHISTYEVQKLAAKRDGSRLYVLGAVNVGDPVCLLTPTSLLSGKIIQNSTIAFHQHSSTPLLDITDSHPTNGFLITTGTTYQGLKGPLAALIFSKNGLFSARYDQIGTIFVAKDKDFDPNSVISVLIFAKNGQKWLYSGKIEGKILRFDRNRYPRGPL